MLDRNRLRGLLLGTALGDALGLAAEGLKPATITRRFPHLDRFHLLGTTGYVSDDTEQAALVAQSLLRGARSSTRSASVFADQPDAADVAAVVRAFRGALRAWFVRLPFGIGLSTLKACLRLLVGLERSGVRSAGNGAVMRAPVVGVVADPAARRALAEAVARVTHTDPRAVEAAVFVTHLAAFAGAAQATDRATRQALIAAARADVRDAELAAALDHGLVAELTALKTTGFVLHTVPLVARVFLDHGDDVLAALQVSIRLGGDTDTHAALVGALVGALHGEAALPAHLLAHLARGPFGVHHLRALADALASLANGPPGVPRFSATVALLRNLALYPVILGHGFWRLVRR